MAQRTISVTWNPNNRKVSVDPDPVTLYWGEGYRDTALWDLTNDGGDSGAFIEEIEFDGSDPKGCFGTLGQEQGSNRRKWDGGQLKHQNGTWKYTIKVKGGNGQTGELDPNVETDEKP